jgi:hypothetical protein
MELSFKGTDGTSYQLSKLTYGDLIDLDQYLQYRDWVLFQRMRPMFENPEEFKEQSTQIRVDCSKKKVTRQDGLLAITEFDVQAEMLRLSLKHKYADITVSKIESILSMDMLAEIAEKLVILTGAMTEDEMDVAKGKKAAPEKKGSRPKKGSS